MKRHDLKKIIFVIPAIVMILNLYVGTAFSTTIKGLTVVQNIAVAPDDFMGSISLAEANLYEDDFNSKYLFPMQGLCTTGDGKIAVIDNSYGRVHILNTLLDNVFTFGSISQLIYPTDIAFYSGNFYISDALGGDIAVYSQNGMFVKSIGKGVFNTPTGVTVLGGNIFVADYFNQKIYKLDQNGNILKTFDINFPGGLSTDNSGKIAAISMSGNTIYILDPNLNLFGTITGKELVSPVDSVFDASGNLYVVDRGLSRGKPGDGKVLEYSKDGKLIKTIGSSASTYAGQPDGTFLTPDGITTDSFGNIYVMDSGYYYWNSQSEAPFGFPLGIRISVFSPSGIFLSKQDYSQNSAGALVNPLSASLDENGSLWVINYGGFQNSELDQFSSTGTLAKRITKIQGQPFPEAYSVFADKKGNVFVGANGAIAIFSSSGDFKNIIRNDNLGIIRKIIKGSDGFLYLTVQDKNTIVKMSYAGVIQKTFNVCNSPSGIIQDSSGNFYVTSIDDNKIHVYNNSFQELRTIGLGGGRGSYQFYVPEDIGIDKYGNLVVCDTENGRISFFSKDGALLFQSDRIFYEPSSIEFEDGMFIVTDCFHNIIRIVSENVADEQYSFYASVYPDTVLIGPGDDETVMLNVGNNGTSTDTYSIALQKYFPQTWSVNFADNMPSTFSLTPNSARSIKLVVKVPSSAKDGDKGNFQIDVVSSATKLKKSYSVNISVSTNLPLTIYSDDATGQVGSTVSVPLYLQNANSIRGVSFEVAFNRTNLQFQGATLDESLNDDLLLAKDNGQSIDVAFSSTNGTSISGKALLLNLNFKALKMSTNQLQYNNLYAINVVDIPLEVEGVPSLLSVTPYLSVNFSDNTVSSSQNFQFTGKTTPGCTVTVNGSTVQVKSDGTFSATTSLIYENNTISIISQSTSGEKTVVNRTVFYKGKKTITIKLQIDNPIMTVNGTQMEIDPGRGTVPVIMKGWDRTIVPIRAIVEVIGGTVSWDANARMVLIELKGNSIKLWIDNPVAEVNGQKVAIDPDNNLIKPVIVNSRTYVPLRFVSENLGCTVSWDNSTRTVTIVYSE
jgi:sugar lactone lactonase YvrE